MKKENDEIAKVLWKSIVHLDTVTGKNKKPFYYGIPKEIQKFFYTLNIKECEYLSKMCLDKASKLIQQDRDNIISFIDKMNFEYCICKNSTSKSKDKKINIDIFRKKLLEFTPEEFKCNISRAELSLSLDNELYVDFE